MKIIHETPIVLTHELMNNRCPRMKVEGPRSPGVHVQAVNKSLGVAAGKLDADEDSPFERMTEEVYPLMMALGVGWEEFRASHYSESELLWQPGELERDGMFGTPDGLLVSDEPTTWECKRTTKKIQSIAGCWLYLKQGLTYGAMSGIYRTQYDILWVCGDYSRPYQPKATSSLVEFTEKECESWWTVLVKAAKNVKAE